MEPRFSQSEIDMLLIRANAWLYIIATQENSAKDVQESVDYLQAQGIDVAGMTPDEVYGLLLSKGPVM